ncbi:hypothetical protein PO909_018452 [Leuciscus waleckii]
MVQYCCIVNCCNRSHDRQGKRLINHISFPYFRRMAWVAAGRQYTSSYRTKTVDYCTYDKLLLKCNKPA